MTEVHPPKPVFCFAVGVTGHRLHRLPHGAEKQIRDQAAAVFKALSDAGAASHARHHASFGPGPGHIQLVSGLAEGADRFVADEALRQKLKLAATLPFLADEYEKDFATKTSKQEFRDQLAASGPVLQLEGDRTEEGKSYELAGLAMLDASDLLIAVWDGEPAAGRGGTTEIVYEATRRGMPILRINPSDGAMQLYWHGGSVHHGGPAYFEKEFHSDPIAGLQQVVDRLVRPPHAKSEATALKSYLHQHFRRWIVSFEFPLLMNLLGLRWMKPGDFLRTPPDILAVDMARHEIAPQTLLGAYAWADEIAVVFGQAFRGAFVANFFLAAAATILVVAGNEPASFLEFAAVVAVIVNTYWGRRRRWHHLWIEAREVAEQLRVAIPIHAAGSRSALPFGDAPTWTSWYVRAQLRQAGLRNAALDGKAVEAVRKSLRAFLQGQAAYHGATAKRFSALHRRLWGVGILCFGMAFVVCTTSILVEISDWLPLWLSDRFLEYFSTSCPTQTGVGRCVSHWLVAMSAGFPAAAAAFYGIRVIGDFDGAAARSQRMHTQLVALTHALKETKNLDGLREMSQRTAEVMLGDVASWRLVVESRELEMPG